MAIDLQRSSAIRDYTEAIEELMRAAEKIANVDQLIADADLGTDPPTQEELEGAGFDWFDMAQLQAARAAADNVLAVVQDDLNRIPMNAVRKQI